MPALCWGQLAFIIICINIYQKPIKPTIVSYAALLWSHKWRLKFGHVCATLHCWTTLDSWSTFRKTCCISVWISWMTLIVLLLWLSVSVKISVDRHHHHHPVIGSYTRTLIDAGSVSSLQCVSDTSRNKGLWCSPPPQFTAVPPPVIARVSDLTWDSPRCHFWMFKWLLTRRPGARAVVCILLTYSHISNVLIPANIISTEGFILGGEKKQPSFFKSQVISVLQRVKMYKGRFFYLLLYSC